MKKGYEIRLFGRVQGVGFRYFTQRKGKKLNLKGFVKNMPDGSVLINVFGEESQLNKFIEEVKKGPVTANVENFKKEEINVNNSYEGFSIRY